MAALTMERTQEYVDSALRFERNFECEDVVDAMYLMELYDYGRYKANHTKKNSAHQKHSER